MAATGFQGRIYAVDVHRMLFHQYGRYGLEGNAEIDILSVADATLDTSRMVRAGFDASIIVIEYIVLFRTFLLQSFEACLLYTSTLPTICSV